MIAMLGWWFALSFFCLAGIGWWRSEQYRRLCRKNAQLATDAMLALINSELSRRMVDHYTEQMARHARTFTGAREVSTDGDPAVWWRANPSARSCDEWPT